MNRILIIEDNADIRENISEILELADYEVIEAADGREGVEKAIEELPDLIICDIMMPELDGYGVLHILSKKKATMSIPFIFLTAKADKTDVRKGMTLGADDYVTKPFDDTELLDVIEVRLKKMDAMKDIYSDNINDFINGAVTYDQFLNISTSKKSVIHSNKQVIYYQDEIPHSLFYIESGKVCNYRLSEDGKELITDIYGAGDFFGFEALLSGENYSDFAKTMAETKLITISKDEFFQLLYGNKQIAKTFIEMLSNKVVEKEESLLKLAYNTVRQRTAEAILTVSKKYNPEKVKDFELRIPREDLGNMIGTATESVIRVLSEFKEEGVIKIISGKIIIVADDKLAQIAKWNFAR